MKDQRSEKTIERYLVRRVKELGGECLKFSSALQTGWPDRICLFPRGVTIWVELKSTEKNIDPPSEPPLSPAKRDRA